MTTKPDAPVEQPSSDAIAFFLSRLTEQSKNIVSWIATGRAEILVRDRTADLEHERDAARRALLLLAEETYDCQEWGVHDAQFLNEEIALARAALADGEKEGTK